MHNKILLFLVFVLCGSWAGCRSPANESKWKITRQFKESFSSETNLIDGIEYTASVQKQGSFSDFISLTLTTTNKRTKAATWNRMNDYQEYQVWVFDDEGKHCELSDFGKSVMGGDPGERSWNEYLKLDPRSSHIQEMDLAKLFILKPGEYTITSIYKPLEWGDPGYVKLSIKNLVFEVTK